MYYKFICVVILCAVVAVMLALFVIYHVYLIYAGYTTNEKIKQSQMIWYMEKLVNFLAKWEKLASE